MVIYRVAKPADVPQLAAMRWEFRTEESGGVPSTDREVFLRECCAFLLQGLIERRWTYWVATEGDQIVSHIFVQRVPKVPKPDRIADALGYVTNVYTLPAFRNRGIGAKLMEHLLRWSVGQDLESLIVWPSDRSIRFYERAGFRKSTDMLEYSVRPYVE